MTDRLSNKARAVIALSAALLVAAVLPFGCSKGEKQAPQAKAEAPASDPGREHFEKGLQYSMKGQLDDAIKEYELTLKINPNSYEAYNNLGFAYFDKGDVDRAVESQKKSIELNQGWANAYYGLALALEKKGDKKGALENWKQFAKLSEPHSKWWMQAQAHINRLEGKKPGAAKKK